MSAIEMASGMGETWQRAGACSGTGFPEQDMREKSSQSEILMADKDGVRPGEVAVELPKQFDAGLYFIGRIRTPWMSRDECPKNAREARERGVICTIELDPRWAD